MATYSPNSVSDSTTQEYLEIFDITNNILILRDGSAAMILSVNSLNFGLLSEEEQDAIIFSYAGLLNSLTFPVQIVIRSQRKDISKYLNYLKEAEVKTKIPLRKVQISHYRQFVEGLVKERNILDKKFYVVIPFPETSMVQASTIPSVKKAKPVTIDRAYVLEKALATLEPRRDHMVAQFARIGLQARQLSTQEIIQTLYQIYNPGTSEGTEVADTKSYTTPLVQASIERTLGTPMTVVNPSVVAMPEAPQYAPEQQVVDQQYQAGAQPAEQAMNQYPVPPMEQQAVQPQYEQQYVDPAQQVVQPPAVQ